MMNRRTFIVRVAAGLLAVPFAAGAQQAARLPRVGVLYPFKAGGGAEALRQGLRDLGYVEGRTAVIEWRWWEGKVERLHDAAAEMVRLNPDVIVVGGSEATKAMKEATRSIPIVFSGPSYPVEEGLVQSFARPAATSPGSPSRSPTMWRSSFSFCWMSPRHSSTSPSSGALPIPDPHSPSETWKPQPAT